MKSKVVLLMLILTFLAVGLGAGNLAWADEGQSLGEGPLPPSPPLPILGEGGTGSAPFLSMGAEELGRRGEVVRSADRSPLHPRTSAPLQEGHAGLTFSNQAAEANIAMTHATPFVKGFPVQMVSGGAAADFNNDGWTDLFVIGGGVTPDALYVNQGDGTFQNVAREAGLAKLHAGSGAAVGDYNGDGWLDLYVTSLGPQYDIDVGQHLLYRNNGDLTFTNVAVEAGVNETSREYPDGMGAAFGDYDLDGDLDLFVAGWRTPRGEPALGNRLFRNNGDGTFDDVTVYVGIEDDGIHGFSPCFVDMNGDRYPELLLAADFGTTHYFKNNTDGTFTDYTTPTGAYLPWSGMGTAVGDINNDGLFDWYVTAIYDDNTEGRGDGSKMFLNQGDHHYTEVAQAAGVDDAGWGWGTVIVDLDHDGWQDVAATNGWDLVPYNNEPSKLWVNDGTGNFAEMAMSVGFDHSTNGLGLLNLDYDNDGDQDLVVTGYHNDLYLYRNDLARDDANWLRLFLDTQGVPGLAPNGYGARVTLTANGQTQYRYLGGCSHYLTSSEPSVHFGLGGAQFVDELVVEWPDGSTTQLTGVGVNQTLTVRPQGAMTNKVLLPLVSK